MTWDIVYTKQAQKDAKKPARSGSKTKAIEQLEVIKKNSLHNPLHTKSRQETYLEHTLVG